MKKILLLVLLLAASGIFAQSPQYMAGPANYGLEAPYTDRGMIPLYADGNDLFALTRKKDPAANNMLRNYLVRINTQNDSMHFYDNVALSGTADFYGPRQFSTAGNYIYFNCGWRLYRLDKATNAVVEYLSDCDHYYVTGNYIIFDYWNSSKTWCRNMATNVTTEVKTADNRSMSEIGSMYEYNGEIYFWGTGSMYQGRRNGIYKYNPVTKVTTNYITTHVQNGNSEIYQGNTEVKRINDNLVYLIKDSDYKLKFVSVNLLTQTLNSSFTFNTNNIYGTAESFVIDGVIYVNKEGQTYMSDGIATPVPAPMNFAGSTFVGVYDAYIDFNGYVFTTITTEAHGNEIWKTNGTAAGTHIMADLEPGEGSSFYSGGSPVVHNGSMYFCTSLGTVRLYKTDGTAAGTLPLTLPGEFTYIGNIRAFGNSLYFYGKKANGEIGLYKTGTTPLPTSSIVCAEVFNDLNADGLLNNGETGTEDVNITITAAPPAFAHPTPHVVSTGQSGIYCFTGLPEGTYSFTVDVPEGWEASNGSSPYFTVNVPSANQGNTYRIGLRATLSSQQFDKSQFTLYPNPAETTVTIATENYNGGIIELFDISGKKLISRDISANAITLDVSYLASGMYMLKLASGGKAAMQKLIIR